MQNASPTSDLAVPTSSVEAKPRWKREDLAYQSLTVPVILLFLFSLWRF